MRVLSEREYEALKELYKAIGRAEVMMKEADKVMKKHGSMKGCTSMKGFN